MHSDIHVVVRFHEQSVFAGEELRCTITFKNVANASPESGLSPWQGGRRTSRRESIGQIAAAVQAARNKPAFRPGQPDHGRRASSNNTNEDSADDPRHHGRHRATASLQNSPGNGNGGLSNNDRLERPGVKQRSVSIISVTSPLAGPGAADLADSTASNSWAKQQRLSHQRSSTVQIQNGSARPPIGGRRSSPFSPAASGGGHLTTPAFRFPETAKTEHAVPENEKDERRDDWLQAGAAGSPNASVTRIASQEASDRSSGDFYSLSNHSQETLMSEQPSIVSVTSDHRPNLGFPTAAAAVAARRPAMPRPPPPQQQQRSRAVNLLMGYAQLGATFTLDASLIDQSHFEEVKAKGFLGGQAGGGVVGVKKKKSPRPNSVGGGFLGNFNLNFNNIGGSLNSLLVGGGEETMSSVKGMHAVTSSRAIPLLSTPQSLLFVDMHLEPGEEQSYSYAFPLPHGLPSSHRGKAIKISYNLTVGVQGLPGSGDAARDVHTVRQVNIPIRVFPGVNYDGEIFGHDLMQPHVILRDLARTRSLVASEEVAAEIHPTLSSSSSSKSGEKSDDQSTAEFLQFVDDLLDRDRTRRRQSSSGTIDHRRRSTYDEAGREEDHRGSTSTAAAATIQAISRAILYSNSRGPASTQGGHDRDTSSSNRFEIARNGRRVAVIVIDRPLHRLGETVTAVVDFSEGQVPCASLRSTLETTEKVTPSLAVRSAATVNRVTRKVYASRSDNVLFARRATFAPSVPASATPTFVTSGVNLDWSLRFEFGTIKPDDHPDENENDDGGDEKDSNDDATTYSDLLEEVVKDERGTMNVAAEYLDCETFEVVIPLTVYGDLVPDGKEGEEIVGVPI